MPYVAPRSPHIGSHAESCKRRRDPETRRVRRQTGPVGSDLYAPLLGTSSDAVSAPSGAFDSLSGESTGQCGCTCPAYPRGCFPSRPARSGEREYRLDSIRRIMGSSSAGKPGDRRYLCGLMENLTRLLSARNAPVRTAPGGIVTGCRGFSSESKQVDSCGFRVLVGPWTGMPARYRLLRLLLLASSTRDQAGVSGFLNAVGSTAGSEAVRS